MAGPPPDTCLETLFNKDQAFVLTFYSSVIECTVHSIVILNNISKMYLLVTITRAFQFCRVTQTRRLHGSQFCVAATLQMHFEFESIIIILFLLH